MRFDTVVLCGSHAQRNCECAVFYERGKKAKCHNEDCVEAQLFTPKDKAKSEPVVLRVGTNGAVLGRATISQFLQREV